MVDYINEIKGFSSYARKAAAEGIVLLKNEDEVLPIIPSDEVALFGRCQIDYYRSGTGSGGSVNVPYTVNAVEGFELNKNINTNKYLLDLYANFVKENPFDNGGGGWAAEPWFQKEMRLTEDIVKTAKGSSNKAVIIIGRTAGEDQDNGAKPGSYYLTEDELDMLNKVCSLFNNVIVVLNVSNTIDMSWLENSNLKNSIKSVLYSWQGGMEGGNALADVLSGDVTPSGKLTDTISYRLEDHPSDKNFGNEISNIYAEDIYVGYRYFETFNKDAVQFPFGFGLSYTSFTTKQLTAQILGEGSAKEFVVRVAVTNSGDKYSGKEVVQLYYSAPQGVLGKPEVELIAFKKSRILKPGETQELEFKIDLSSMASYDDSGITGYKSSYILEKGGYRLFFGNSVRNLNLVEFDKEIILEDNIVVKELEEALAPQESFKRVKPGDKKADGTYSLEYEETPKSQISLKDRMESRKPKDLEITGDRGIKLIDVKNKKSTMDEFLAQLTQKELEIIVRGEGMSSPKVTSGTAGAFGGVGDSLIKLGIPVACCADGPSGIRRDSGEIAMQLPIGTLLACSWDVDMVRELYKFEGMELVLNEIDSLLGPGINIHRHPLNGRNFEYFSEDPYLTGLMASAVTLGIKDGGSTGTVKHFACNDQEYKRSIVDSVVSERALREIHLKAFEMVVKEGEAVSIMTAYNPINGIWTASNYDLNTTILRGEWGFKGIVMTDWWAKMNDPVNGGEPSIQQAASMVRAQNDIYMLVNNYGAEVNGLGDDLSESVESGVLTIGELQRCARNICNFILDAKVIERPIKEPIVTKVPAAVGDTAEFKTNSEIKFNTTVDGTKTFIVDEEGEYSLVIYMCHDNDPAAQSSCNLLLNNEYITNIQLNGSFGNWVRQKDLNVYLEKGLYQIDIKFTKPGLEIGHIVFTKN
ncbi:beta-glucosidase [Thiospirochaeta perfilievii]|uniref:Beta-glucosidase n=1 Tax=Thiospirochaeta perfilievii TaxID=252967 RepID=A0A5C1QCM3_9SPIO|nr:glycoside hydrolase family 3 protein [Thiospirochaeta perfilievii]QEN05291.1 beta-glucosidase [Thiospirochaeta perfilievii]